MPSVVTTAEASALRLRTWRCLTGAAATVVLGFRPPLTGAVVTALAASDFGFRPLRFGARAATLSAFGFRPRLAGSSFAVVVAFGFGP